MTGRPYTEQGGILAQDEEERLGFIFGGVASRLARFAPTKPLKKLLLLIKLDCGLLNIPCRCLIL